MAVDILILPRAELDLEKIFAWYEYKRPGLGDRFARQMDKCLDRIRALPLAFAKVRRTYRQADIKKIPYSVYFDYSGGTLAVVYTVLHNRRSKSTIRRRLP